MKVSTAGSNTLGVRTTSGIEQGAEETEHPHLSLECSELLARQHGHDMSPSGCEQQHWLTVPAVALRSAPTPIHGMNKYPLETRSTITSVTLACRRKRFIVLVNGNHFFERKVSINYDFSEYPQGVFEKVAPARTNSAIRTKMRSSNIISAAGAFSERTVEECFRLNKSMSCPRKWASIVTRKKQ